MRYFVLAAITAICFLLQGAVFTSANIWGIAPDVFILFMVSFVIAEKSITPILYTVIGAIFLDFLYSDAIGFFAFPYAIVGMFVFILNRDKPLTSREKMSLNNRPLLTAGLCVIICFLIQSAESVVLRYDFNLFFLLWRYILPSAVLTAILMAPMSYIVRSLESKPWMRPQK